MKKEKATYTQSGFKCTNCDFHTKTYNGLKPSICPNCDSVGTLKMEWNQEVSILSVTTQLPLEG